MINYCFSKEIQIGDRIISHNSPTFIIAEAGVNHNGDITKAFEMIDVAIDAGVDAIKFQTFSTDDLILKSIEKAPYQKITTGSSETQYEMLKKLELDYNSFADIKEYCDKKKILFLSTPFESRSLHFLDSINVAAFKISSTDITNAKLLIEVAKLNKPIILSAGMCDINEVDTAINILHNYNKNVILMQCTSNYPVADEEVNLNVIKTFYSRYGILTGFSDHSEGVGASPYAVAAGAKIIEKHFTLNKNDIGPDHKASLNPDELIALVKEIRKVEKYLGDGNKAIMESETHTKKSLQKSLVAIKSIKIGDVFSEDNISAKRANGLGIPAIEYCNVIGLVSKKNYNVNDIIEL